MYYFQQKQKVCVFSLWVSFFMLFCRCLTFNSIHLNWQKPKYLPTSKWQQRTQHKIIIFRFFFLFSSEFFFCFVLFPQCPRIQWQKAFNYISPQSDLSEKKKQFLTQNRCCSIFLNWNVAFSFVFLVFWQKCLLKEIIRTQTHRSLFVTNKLTNSCCVSFKYYGFYFLFSLFHVIRLVRPLFSQFFFYSIHADVGIFLIWISVDSI